LFSKPCAHVLQVISDITDNAVSGSSESQTREVQHTDAVRILIQGRQAPTLQDKDGVIFQDIPTIDSADEPNNGIIVVIGDQTVVPAIELGVKFMTQGQTAKIWSHSKYALGLLEHTYTLPDNTQGTLPPESNVMYTVTLLEVIPNDDITSELRYEIAVQQKSMGNLVYQHEWTNGMALSRVKYLYKKCATEMERLWFQLSQELSDMPEETSFETRDKMLVLMYNVHALRLDALNNVVAAYLRAQDYSGAKAAAIHVIQVDAQNAKALLRAAKAALYDPASSYEEVHAALEAAERVIIKASGSNSSSTTTGEPCLSQEDKEKASQRKELQSLQRELKRQEQEYKKRSKTMFAKLGLAKSSASQPLLSSQEDDDHNGGSSKEKEMLDEIVSESQQEPTDDKTKTAQPETTVEKPNPSATTSYMFTIVAVLFVFLMLYAFARIVAFLTEEDRWEYFTGSQVIYEEM
jgi:hypothetical protein